MRGDILQMETEVRFHVESDNGEFVTYALRMRSGRRMKNQFGGYIEAALAPERVEIPEPGASARDWRKVAAEQLGQVFGSLAVEVDQVRGDARAGRSQFFNVEHVSNEHVPETPAEGKS